MGKFEFKKIILITGISGAGKTIALRCLEDMNFYCIDNLPLEFIPKLLENLSTSENKKKFTSLAFGIDVREDDFLNKFFNITNYLKSQKNILDYKILFLEADDEILIRRFTETRRKHPLSNGKDSFLKDNITLEKKLLINIRNSADKIINTSNLSTNRLKEIIKNYFFIPENKEIIINFISFGFKYGIPIDVDMLFDVRFLPNPYYFDNMRNFTGNDEIIKNFIFSTKISQIFVSKTIDFLNFLIPKFIKEGKNYLNIYFGCTGGKHRSVAITNNIFEYFKKNFNKNFSIGFLHRDIKK